MAEATPPTATNGARAPRTAFVLVTLGLALVVGLVLIEATLALLDLPRTRREFRFLEGDGRISELFTSNEGIFEYDPDVLWRLDPETDFYVANELGLRGWLPHRAKSERDLRIVCVGDSCTFGFGVHYEDTYGVRVERMLQAAHPGRCVETVLAGVVGHSTQQNVVLYRDALAALEPDITVLYVGTWNDHLGSVGLSDSERYAQRHDFRLTRLWNRTLGDDRTGDASDPEVLAAFKRGEAPFGRRVPPDEFRANLEELHRLARGAGSRVVCIVPPLPQKTLERMPTCLDYRAYFLEFARSHDLPVVDGPALFEGHLATLPEAERLDTLLFSDWAHPTTLGHELLAGALYEAVAPFVTADARTAPPPPVDGIEPARVTALARTTLTLRGPGLGADGAFDRLWIGDRWANDAAPLDTDTVRATVPLLPAGDDHPVQLVTRDGAFTVGSIAVAPPPAHHPLTVTRDGDTLDVSCDGPFGAWVSVWWSTERRTEPANSPFGPFELTDGRPDEVLIDGGVFRLDLLELGRALAWIGRGGRWHQRMKLTPEAAGRAVYVQGAIVDPATHGLATVTELVVAEP